jgi:hypothetical protein
MVSRKQNPMPQSEQQLISRNRVVLGPQHLRPGRTKHTISDSKGIREFPPFVALEIASYPGDDACYLFHLCETGEGTDTSHECLSDAMYQAEYEFGVVESEWQDVNHPFGSSER